MSAVAARTVAVNRQSAHPTVTVRRTRRVRRMKPRARRFVSMSILFGLLVCVFAYVGIHASMTSTSYDKSRLGNELRQEQIKNERLRYDYAQRCGYGFATAAAQQAGMVTATRFEYLRPPETVASAR